MAMMGQQQLSNPNPGGFQAKATLGQMRKTVNEKAVPGAITGTVQPIQQQPARPVQQVSNPNPGNPTQMPAMPTAPPTPQISSPNPGGGPALNLNATPGKDSVDFLEQIKQRLLDQQSHENDSLKSSAERAISTSHRDISDAAAARKKLKSEELAARGLSGGAGAGAGQLRAVDEAAQTRQAKSASDISLGRERDQDALDMQRQQMVNSLYGQAGQAAQTPFNQQLQGNQLNLNAWNSLSGNELQKAQLKQGGDIANANLQMQGNQQQQQQQMAMWQMLMGMK